MRCKIVWLLFAFSSLFLLGADDLDHRHADKQALASLQSYVGSWRGVGQVRRGSSRGSWSEQSAWKWKFSDDQASLVFESPAAKFFLTGQLRPTDKTDEFHLLARDSSGNDIEYVGSIDNQRLVLLAKDASAGQPARITARLVAGGDRLVMLYEKRLGTSDRFTRMAEVGYTREGSGFGQGSSYPECIVTGGKATIAVTHNGKTYYVCCSGCKDLFDEDPEGVLAEYKTKLAAKQGD